MSIPSWARKGNLVVCVDGAPRPMSTGLLPKQGGVYTIERVEPAWVWGTGQSGSGIHLVELKRPAGMVTGKVHPFNIDRFRPLVDNANDSEIEAEIYRKKVHQNGAPVKELERT